MSGFSGKGPPKVCVDPPWTASCESASPSPSPMSRRTITPPHALPPRTPEMRSQRQRSRHLICPSPPLRPRWTYECARPTNSAGGGDSQMKPPREGGSSRTQERRSSMDSATKDPLYHHPGLLSSFSSLSFDNDGGDGSPLGAKSWLSDAESSWSPGPHHPKLIVLTRAVSSSSSSSSNSTASLPYMPMLSSAGGAGSPHPLLQSSFSTIRRADELESAHKQQQQHRSCSVASGMASNSSLQQQWASVDGTVSSRSSSSLTMTTTEHDDNESVNTESSLTVSTISNIDYTTTPTAAGDCYYCYGDDDLASLGGLEIVDDHFTSSK